MKIQICRKFTKINKLQKKLILAFPHDTITIKKCIDMCKICKNTPTAKVEKKKFKTKRISTLIAKLQEH